MDSTPHSQQTQNTRSLGGVADRELVVQDPGLTRLAVMVGTVFERLTSADEHHGQAGPTA